MKKFTAICTAAVAMLFGCAQVVRVERADLLSVGERLGRTICRNETPVVTNHGNRHNSNIIDRMELRTCSEGSSKLYYPMGAVDVKGFVLEVSVKDKAAGLPASIEIGTSKTMVLNLLGAPDSEAGESASYELTAEVPNVLTVHYRNKIVSAVDWSFYLD